MPGATLGLSIPVGPTSGGKIYAFNNLGTSPVVVAPANSKRVTLTFHNPGGVAVYVFPTSVQALNPSWNSSSSLDSNTSLSNVALTPSTVAVGGGFFIFAGGGQVTVSGECQGAWQALAASGSNNSLTVSDSNV